MPVLFLTWSQPSPRDETVEDTDAINWALARIDTPCELCGEPSEVWDHAHGADGRRRGAVRGRLCHRCNMRLHRDADEEWFTRAAAYVGRGAAEDAPDYSRLWAAANRARRGTPERKARTAASDRARQHTPEYRARERARRSTPEFKAKRLEYVRARRAQQRSTTDAAR